MASPVNFDVMRHNRFVDSIILYDKRSLRRGQFLSLPAIASFVRSVRACRPDLVIIPMSVSFSFTSCLLSWLSGAYWRVGAGTIDGRSHAGAGFLNLPVDLDWRADPHRHQVLRNSDTARTIVPEPGDLRCELGLTEEERRQGREFLASSFKGSGPMIGFHPGAGKLPNRWPAEHFAGTADILAREVGARILVTEGPMDGSVVGLMRGLLHKEAVIVRGKTIREVASILSQLDLVISNDTGIMHVAAGVGTPVLSLFGPTDPLQWAPSGKEHRFLHRGPEIGTIAVEEVVTNAQEMLAERHAGHQARRGG